MMVRKLADQMRTETKEAKKKIEQLEKARLADEYAKGRRRAKTYAEAIIKNLPTYIRENAKQGKNQYLVTSFPLWGEQRKLSTTDMYYMESAYFQLIINWCQDNGFWYELKDRPSELRIYW